MLSFVACSYGQDGFVDGNPRLAYWTVGNKQNVVIVIHGGPGVQHEYLRPEFDQLTPVAQVIYYDQRGCGKSQQATSYLWQNHIDDLNRLIRALANNRRVFLAGSSWGSTLAMLYAYRFPQHVAGLILSGTYRWPGIEGVYKRTLKFVVNAPQTYLLNELRLVEEKIISGQRQAKLITVSKQVENYSGTAKEEAIESTITAPRLDSLRQVNVPILIVNGDQQNCQIDWGSNYVKIFPQAALYTIPGACHDPWLSNPELFFQKSRQFVQANDPK